MHTDRSTGPISVRVSLFAGLRRYAPDPTNGVVELTLPAGATVAAVRDALGIPAETEIIAGVDGAQVDSDHI